MEAIKAAYQRNIGVNLDNLRTLFGLRDGSNVGSASVTVVETEEAVEVTQETTSL